MTVGRPTGALRLPSQKLFKNSTCISFSEPYGGASVSKIIPGEAGVRALQVSSRHLLDDSCLGDLDLFARLKCPLFGSGKQLQPPSVHMATLVVTFARRLTLDSQSVVESCRPSFHPSRCATASPAQSPSQRGNVLGSSECETDLQTSC